MTGRQHTLYQLRQLHLQLQNHTSSASFASAIAISDGGESGAAKEAEAITTDSEPEQSHEAEVGRNYKRPIMHTRRSK